MVSSGVGCAQRIEHSGRLTEKRFGSKNKKREKENPVYLCMGMGENECAKKGIFCETMGN